MSIKHLTPFSPEHIAEIRKNMTPEEILNEKTNIYRHAKQELDILIKTTPDAIIRDFIPEILELCEKFGLSGQSGASAPYTAAALSQAIKKLCLLEPICPITGIDEEWNDISTISGGMSYYQNNRLSSIFKLGVNGKPYYLDAIVFKGRSGNFNANSIALKDGTTISSRQYIKRFPFTPKIFYIDVIETEWADKNETEKKRGGGWWTYDIKDEKQLKAVWKYYDRYESFKAKDR